MRTDAQCRRRQLKARSQAPPCFDGRWAMNCVVINDQATIPGKKSVETDIERRQRAFGFGIAVLRGKITEGKLLLLLLADRFVEDEPGDAAHVAGQRLPADGRSLFQFHGHAVEYLVSQFERIVRSPPPKESVKSPAKLLIPFTGTSGIRVESSQQTIERRRREPPALVACCVAIRLRSLHRPAPAGSHGITHGLFPLPGEPV